MKGAERFALFADCLLVGCFTALAALPVVTAYPALVTACSVVRERVEDDRSVGPRLYAVRFGQVLRSGPTGVLVPLLVVGVLALDALAMAAGVPGSQLIACLLAVAVSVAAVFGLRAAASWRPGMRWAAVARTAAAACRRDLNGNWLLLTSAVAMAVTAAAVPLTAVLLPGTLAFAAVAVDQRPDSRGTGTRDQSMSEPR